MCDKIAISAHILKIVENDPFLRLQMTAKEMFNRHHFFHHFFRRSASCHISIHILLAVVENLLNVRNMKLKISQNLRRTCLWLVTLKVEDIALMWTFTPANINKSFVYAKYYNEKIMSPIYLPGQHILCLFILCSVSLKGKLEVNAAYSPV